MRPVARSIIRNAVSRAISDPGVGGGVAWSPETLFASAPGDYWDNQAANAFFQDSAATTPVSASGDPCGRFVGQRGNHWLQATSGSRPTYMVESGRKFVRFNGVDQLMQAAALALTGATKATMILGLRQRGFSTTGVVCENAPASAGVGGFGAFVNNGAPSGSFGGGFGSGPSDFVFNNGAGASSERTFVATLVFDPAGASGDARIPLRMDGANVDESQAAAVGTPTGTGLTQTGFTLGARSGGTLYSQIDVHCGILVGGELTGADLANAEQWCAERTGTLLSFEATPVQFNDTGTVVDRGTHLETSTYAFAEYTTTATMIEVTSYTTIYGDFPAWAQVVVMVDGAFHQAITANALGAFTGRVNLPSGTKTVGIVNGLQSRPLATVIGSWPITIRANATLTQIAPTANNRVLFYGDSITVGGNATTPAAQGYVPLVRAAYAPDSVAVEGWGYRALYDDCVDATARAAFVAKVVAWAPERLWMAIGTNDYGLNKWTAAAFGTAYAALLDDLHAALPSATIFAQTPLLRTTETANGSGSTLGDYRTAIATAVSTRTAYATLVDGTAIMTTASLADGVHPTTAGHALYASAVIAELGI